MLIYNTYAIHLLEKVGLDKGQQLAKPYYVGGTPVRRKEFLQVQKNNREWQNKIMSLGLCHWVWKYRLRKLRRHLRIRSFALGWSTLYEDVSMFSVAYTRPAGFSQFHRHRATF